MNADPWWCDETLWSMLAPSMFSPERWQQAEREVDDIVQLVGVEPGATALDLCCGVGRHALALAKRGMQVTGVDRTHRYLEEARRRSSDAGLELEWLEMEMDRFSRADAFDLVVNMFTSWGYYNDERDEAVLSNLYRSVREGGVLLIDTMGREVLARKFRAKDWNRLDDGTWLLEERTVLDGWAAMETVFTRVGDGASSCHRMTHRLFGGVDLRTRLERVGFSRVEIYGGLDGRPYDQYASRLIGVAYR